MTAPTDFIEIPSGALCGEVMQLTCKGPDEERSYVIEYSQQLDPDDYISPTGITWAAGDTALSVTNVTSHGRRFRFTLSGGTLNQQSGLTFVFPLVSGDVREITFVVAIEEQGVLQSGTVPVIMGAQGARGTIIWPYTGSSAPPSDWQPQSGIVLRTGDFVLVSGGSELYTVTVDDTGAASYSLFVILGSGGGGSGSVEDFPVTDAMWCEFAAGLPDSDPNTAGTFWNNNGVVTGSYAGLNLPDAVEYKISISSLNFWFDGLPTSDPNNAGSVWNNSGVPTISVAGVGDTSGYSGINIESGALNLLMGSLYKFSGGSVPNIGLANIWINNANILTRI